MQPQRSSGLIRYAQAVCFSVVLVLTTENPWSLLSTYNAQLSKTNAILVAQGTTITTNTKEYQPIAGLKSSYLNRDY